MKFGKTPVSKRTLALLAATALLFGSGGYLGTKAELEYFSEDAVAGFELEHLHIHLMENGKDVCKGENDIFTVHRSNDEVSDTDTKNEKYKGNLVEYLGYKNDTHYGDEPAYTLGEPGKVEPGRTYDERIGAKNGEDVDEYVRLTVRKYWVNDEGEKDTTLSPDLIKLEYNGKAYNSGAWTRNPSESTTESETYYLKNVLPKNATSALLFNTLTIDKSVADAKNMTRHEETGDDGVIIYTYEYDYNGYSFFIEADVQALQTHNVNDAIKSLWGVSNVHAGGGHMSVG
ncbi:MAG: hypothetical protein E7220_00240 [Clostridiales bacterium]|nr:hypothetical protein [Clostridiales bacterium]